LKWGILLAATNLLIWSLLFLSGYVLYQPVVLILFSPVLGYLSEVTEKRVYGGPSAEFRFRQLMKDILRGVTLSLRNLLRMILLILLAWLMLIIPIAGALLSAAAIFLVQAYYNGCALTDYTLERKDYTVHQRIRFTRTNRARVTGIGIGFMLVLLIPILGWFIAPAYGTVAATLSTLSVLPPKKTGAPSAVPEGTPTDGSHRPKA
jgi:CysZ protein